MLYDGLTIAEGTTVHNLTVESGTSFPSPATAGQLFFKTDIDKLHVYDGSTWTEVGASATVDYDSVVDALGFTPAALDGTSHILSSQLPAIAITDTFVVASQAAMLALTAQTGDVAVRTDLNKSFILKGASSSTLADWQELLSPTQSVTSVNGSTGAVVLTTTNISEGSNQYFTTARARSSISVTGAGSYNSSTGVITITAGSLTIPATQIPFGDGSNQQTSSASLTFNSTTGTISATKFAGDGSGLSALNAANLTYGAVPTARLGTGTADSTTFLRGDNTWAVPPTAAAGSNTQVQYNASNAMAGSSSFTWNNGTSTLSATNIAASGTINVGTNNFAVSAGGYISSGAAPVTNSEYGIQITRPSGGPGAMFLMTIDTTSYGIIGVKAKGTSSNQGIGSADVGDIVIRATAGNNILFSASTLGTEHMRLANGGNFGIGQADPQYKLDVAGVIRSSTGGFRFPDGSVQTVAASTVTSLPFSSITSTPTTVAGYGITDAVPTARTITAGTGLTGGGDLTANRTLTLATSGVTANTYGSTSAIPVITVDTYGRITSVTTATPAGSSALVGTSTISPSSGTTAVYAGVPTSTTFPAIYLTNSSAGADVKASRLFAFSNGDIRWSFLPDTLGSETVWMNVSRSTVTASSIKFTASGMDFSSAPFSSDVSPATNNNRNLGNTTNRWSVVYAATGTINTSDVREKNTILNSSLGLDFINALRPVSYKFNIGRNEVTPAVRDEEGNEVIPEVVTPIPGTRTHWGLIAQEVKEVVDAAGVDFAGWISVDINDPDAEQGLRYTEFIAPLIKAVQELSAQVQTLTARVSDLESN